MKIYGYMVKGELYPEKLNKTLKTALESNTLLPTFLMYRFEDKIIKRCDTTRSELVVITDENMHEYAEYLI